MNATIAPSQPETVLLADGLFLLAHDELNGKPRLSTNVLSLGLAGGLLGELALAEKISLRDESVVVTDPEPPDGALTRAVHLRLLRSVAPRPVRDWLVYFADDALGQVAARLAQDGRLIAQPARLGRGTRYEFADPNGGAKAALGLCTKVMRRQPMDAATAVLAGLVGATGLEHPSLFEVRDAAQARRYLQESLQVLHPPTLRGLILATRAVVESAVVTHQA
jgi:Golgi phosphoprotein 3 (GPP34)